MTNKTIEKYKIPIIKYFKTDEFSLMSLCNDVQGEGCDGCPIHPICDGTVTKERIINLYPEYLL